MRSHAIRFHETGGPDSSELGRGRGRRARPGRGPAAPDRRRPQLHRRLSPHGSLQGAAALGHRQRRRPAWSRRSGRASPISSSAIASPMPPARSAPMPRRGSIRPTALVKLPDGISDRQAAAMMLQGMTVEYLIRRTYPGEGRPDRAAPRRGRRRRPDRQPMAEASRRHRHRHRRQPGEDGARQGPWLRPCHRLPQGRRRQARARAHRRQGRARGL